jgi:TolA-binding protein
MRLAWLFLVMVTLLPLAGCDSGVYSAEKRFWHASRKYDRLMQKTKDVPGVTPVQDYQELIDAFREMTIRYPDWANSARAQFYIGQLYAVQNNLPKAREEFGVILKDYPANTDICATALFTIAVIYEKEGNWEKAKEALDKVVKDYPDTGTAFQIPLYEAEHYKAGGQTAEAETAYAAAIGKYKKIISDSPKTYGALMAIDFAVGCYADRGQWTEAIDYLAALTRDHPDTLVAPKALFVTGAIYQDKLKQPEKALEYYKQIKDKYSKSIFADPAQQLIDLISKPK